MISVDARHQHRGPSYHRRQERRQAARVAAGLVCSPTGEVGDRPPPNGAGLLINLGTIFQTFLDANLIVEKNDLTEEIKAIENEKSLEARKRAFGNDYKYYPPWK
jgi:hypothetical protein